MVNAKPTVTGRRRNKVKKRTSRKWNTEDTEELIILKEKLQRGVTKATTLNEKFLIKNLKKESCDTFSVKRKYFNEGTLAI